MSMRFRTLEIRWHDSKPISTCDFQPIPFKKARPLLGQEMNYAAQSYKLATGGEDNHVRLWMVHPNIRPTSLATDSENASSNNPAARPPRVEYLATLSRHSAAVNVVRFSPSGELIASAGDDGMIIIWAPSSSPQTATYGSDLNPEDMQHEREYWKPRTTFRCTTMQVYDLAWSPSGEYIIAGSTDNAARVFTIADGKCVYEIAEHSHYVQGVAWDPLNEYIATQSSDRSMHIYRISTKGGTFEAHAVGKNTKMPHKHTRRSSHSRSRMLRSESAVSDAESVTSEYQFPPREREDPSNVILIPTKDAAGINPSSTRPDPAPLTPASVASTPSVVFPVPPPPASLDKQPSSRRSSFSSQAPNSPSTFSRYGRSPSPMPPLPAIRSLPLATWSSVKLYGDESFTNFFRRLTFSPDGGLLLTPAGQFEDPSHIHMGATPAASISINTAPVAETPGRGRKGRPSAGGSSAANVDSNPFVSTTSGTSSSVYIYSRANFARPPIAQLPGHKKASVAVRFSPILYELRGNSTSAPDVVPVTGVDQALERGGPGAEKEKESEKEKKMEGVEFTTTSASVASKLLTPQRTPVIPSSTLSTPTSSSGLTLAAPAPRAGGSENPFSNILPNLTAMDSVMRPVTPAASKPPTPSVTLAPLTTSTSSAPLSSARSATPVHSGGAKDVASTSSTPPPAMFALPYRMLFAVVTMDTVAIYDTQQAGPVCLLTKLHYDEFTDMSWSPDGQCLMLSSRDGYCTLVVFDEILPAHHTQQYTIQLQSLAHNLTLPITYSHSASSSSGGGMLTPSTPQVIVHQFPTQHQHTVQHGAVSSSSSSSSVAGGLNPRKRANTNSGDPPLTPAASVVDGGVGEGSSTATPAAVIAVNVGGGGAADDLGSTDVGTGKDGEKKQEPPKKKRRVALTKVSDLGS